MARWPMLRFFFDAGSVIPPRASVRRGPAVGNPEARSMPLVSSTYVFPHKAPVPKLGTLELRS
jgi:hypothetical protein